MINNFLNLVKQSSSSYHSTNFIQNYLEQNNFIELSLEEKFNISKGERYYIKKQNALIAFKVNSNVDKFKLIVSHLDSPGLKLKSNPDIISNGYHQLNVEVYGGPILNTWYDKPLSIAGLVTYLEGDVIQEILIDFEKPICIIPNLAIHMNREINSGVKIDKQKHLLPILSVSDEPLTKDFFMQLLSEKINIDQEHILSFDLELYNTTPPTLLGIKDEFILSPKLDNLSMALASIEGLIHSRSENGISMSVCLDAEEVGSRTLNGGDSSFVGNILERILLSLNFEREFFLRSIEKSYCISADLAHSVHPNFPDKMDLTNKPVINKGFVIKKSHNKKYATEARLEAKIINLAKKSNLPYQMFFNNSNEAGGSTIGPLLSSNLSIQTIDIGNPILGMHSERETGGVMDYSNIIQLFTNYFGE